MGANQTRPISPSQRPDSAARQLLLQINIALLTGDEIAEDALDATVTAREFDHAFGEWRAKEVSIEPSPHLRRPLQLAAEVLAPALFILLRSPCEMALREQFS